MSYNLLFDTNFRNIENGRWKLTNCKYEDGYLIAIDKIFSIEQTITLPDPTKLYFAIDYINFDPNIVDVMVGIKEKDTLYATKKKVKNNKRVKLSVSERVSSETITIMFIIESKSNNSKIYIDSPILLDLLLHNKRCWPKSFLDNIIDYRYGYDYKNLYKQCEITIDNEDFISSVSDTEKANTGVLVKCKENDWFPITCDFEQDKYYLIKLDYEELNNYGDIYFKYGECISQQLKDQLFIIFKGDVKNKLRLKIENKEPFSYNLNLKHLLIIDLTDMVISEDDIPHMPFI